MKFTSFITGPSGQSRSAFQDWFLRDYAPALVRSCPNLRDGVVRRVIDTPRGAHALDAAGEAACGIAPYDVALELWLSSTEDFRREVLKQEDVLREMDASYATYLVTPKLHKDPRAAEAGPAGRRPEITFIIPIRWKPSVDPAFAEEDWDQHAAIGLRTQRLFTKYEQNIVRDVISWSGQAPAIDAYGDISMRTIEDLVNGYSFSLEEAQDLDRILGGFRIDYLGDARPLAD